MAIGREAIVTGYTVLFKPATTLVAQLAKAHGDGRLDERLAHYAKPKLLIVDELGYLPFEPNAAHRALVTIRLEKLLQGGLVDDAGEIAAAIHLDNDPDFARVQADALLYAGHDKDVCGDLTATRLSSELSRLSPIMKK